MSKPRPGRPQNLLIDIAWFAPALAVFSLAAFVHHPAVVIALLAGNALTMMAVAHALHLRRRPADLEPLVLGGVAYFALFAAYSAVFALVAFFPSRLVLGSASFGAALLLSAAVFVLLLAPWRAWPAFGLAPLLDELRARRRVPGLAETIGGSVDLAHRLTMRDDLFFPLGLIVSVALFALALGACVIAGVGVDLPETTRLIALGSYALVLAPLACGLAFFGGKIFHRFVIEQRINCFDIGVRIAVIHLPTNADTPFGRTVSVGHVQRDGDGNDRNVAPIELPHQHDDYERKLDDRWRQLQNDHAHDRLNAVAPAFENTCQSASLALKVKAQ